MAALAKRVEEERRKDGEEEKEEKAAPNSTVKDDSGATVRLTRLGWGPPSSAEEKKELAKIKSDVSTNDFPTNVVIVNLVMGCPNAKVVE